QQQQTEEKSGMSIKELINSRLKAKSDTVSISIPKSVPPKDTTKIKQDTVKVDTVNTDDYQFEDLAPSKPVDVFKTEPKVEEKKVNTEDYSFEDEAVKNKQPSETFLT